MTLKIFQFKYRWAEVSEFRVVACLCGASCVSSSSRQPRRLLSSRPQRAGQFYDLTGTIGVSYKFWYTSASVVLVIFVPFENNSGCSGTSKRIVKLGLTHVLFFKLILHFQLHPKQSNALLFIEHSLELHITHWCPIRAHDCACFILNGYFLMETTK